MEFRNTYEEQRRAAAYDQLELGGTYHLAFRDLPELLGDPSGGDRALDFGCGTGRSTRFLRHNGFRPVGLDISAAMVAIARQHDPAGDYRVIEDGDFSSIPEGSVDLVLAAFTFDNIPGHARRARLLSGLRGRLAPAGRLVLIASTPEIYCHEWVTFSTSAFPENRTARAGDVVRIVTTDYDDPRPVDDVLWPDESYRTLFAHAGLTLDRAERPLATGDEGIAWISETRVAPWVIYVLRPTPVAAS